MLVSLCLTLQDHATEHKGDHKLDAACGEEKKEAKKQAFPGLMSTFRVHPEIAKQKERIVAQRRHFHQHPEVAFEEKETAKLIADELKSLKFDEVLEGVGKTGKAHVLTLA